LTSDLQNRTDLVASITRAAVWHGSGDVRIEKRMLPDRPPEEFVRLAVDWCGICGSDVAEFVAGPLMIRDVAHPLTGQATPVTLGHEIAGRIAALGDRVDGFEVGDRVVVDACWRCGKCEWCLSGSYNICPLGASVGLHSHGGFAELVDVPAYTAQPIPDGVPQDLAALAEPLAVGVHAVRQGRMRLGHTVAIYGAGPIGIACLIAARAAGASATFVIEPNPNRRRLASQLGAAEAVDPAIADVAVRDRTTGRGVDVAIECTGHPTVLEAALRATRRGGRVVLAGIPRQQALIDVRRIVLYERQVIGSLGYAGDVRVALDLINSRLDEVGRMVTGRIPLAKLVEDGFVELARAETVNLKILVNPRA
jgi:(R,R)-butanediol dehydrogenase / meso-butanediol dehydrogenase / diacetyl reductase